MGKNEEKRDVKALPPKEIPSGDLWRGYVIAVAGTAVAVVVRWALHQTIGYMPRFITFYPVVFAAAVIGGTRPGVLATLLSALAIDLLFVEHRGYLMLNLPDTVAFAIFVVTNVGVSILGGRLKKQSEALRQRENWFRTLADAIPQLTWIARADGYLFWYNRRCFEYGGVTQEQLNELGWEDFIHPAVRATVLERWRHAVETGEPYEAEFPLRRADGQYRTFLVRALPLPDERGQIAFWFGTGTDITDVRESERALRRQARMIDLCPAATLVLRSDGTITFWSDGAEKLYGWSREEALGHRADELLRTETPEPIRTIVANIKHGGSWAGELTHYHKNGNKVVVQTYLLGELNARGELEEILESNTDITSRKHLEEHLQEEVDARTAKLRETVAELEYMSYSMIHDMRAPLRAMQSFAGVLEEECPDCQHPPGSQYLEIIRHSARRLDQFVTDALNYNKIVREEVPLGPVEVAPLLRGIIETYPIFHPRLVDIVVDVGDATVLGNESLLTQTFGNLLDNAVKFVVSGVRPYVRIWAEEIAVSDRPSLIRISIQDNGIGIAPQAQQKMFHMFQRMHRPEEYPGTGIGLAIVKKAMERMDGRVGLESKLGEGSTFWIELPKATQPQHAEQAAIEARH